MILAWTHRIEPALQCWPDRPEANHDQQNESPFTPAHHHQQAEPDQDEPPGWAHLDNFEVVSHVTTRLGAGPSTARIERRAGA
jgi:hypothetical protein